MYNKDFENLVDKCIYQYNNIRNINKAYRVKNISIKKTENNIQENINHDQENKSTEPEETKVIKGYLSVGVYTAQKALPVPDAVVTVYTTGRQEEGENIIKNLITDANGQVPTIELPVLNIPELGFDYTTYNMRIQAIGYYTVNVLDLRIFPNITTNFSIDMIPVIVGRPETVPQKTIVIPPPPVEEPIKGGT